MPNSPNINLAVPFFMVHDMDVSLRFYVGQLGFAITNQWEPRGKIEWCWLQRDGVSIMLQEQRDKEKYDQERPRGVGASICFQCRDALALYQSLRLKGWKSGNPW